MKKMLIATLIASSALAAMGGDIKIKDHDMHIDRAGKGYRLAPSVTLDAGEKYSTYGVRPVVTVTALIKTKKTGSLSVSTFNYMWANGCWQEKSEKMDVEKWSTAQPNCDYKELSSITLKGNPEKQLQIMAMPERPDVLAVKTRVYVGGRLVAEHETKERECTWKDWENI